MRSANDKREHFCISCCWSKHLTKFSSKKVVVIDHSPPAGCPALTAAGVKYACWCLMLPPVGVKKITKQHVTCDERSAKRKMTGTVNNKENKKKSPLYSELLDPRQRQQTTEATNGRRRRYFLGKDILKKNLGRRINKIRGGN